MSLGRSLRLYWMTHRRGILTLLAAIFACWALANASFMAVSSHEAACTICHTLAPHHRSWRQSTHSGVACVRCHDLGFGYFTGALFKELSGWHRERPLAVVRNESCLQPDCHEPAVVERASGFGQKIAFDHTTHLQQMRRGEKLWCTSCHSSDLEGGAHFSTHEQVCYLCHFKGAAEGRSVTECSTCHTAPARQVDHAGFRFDHQAYMKLGVGCGECHVRITRGEAEVERSRCHRCHSERLERYDDFEFMHGTHVAARGISCFRCHGAIEHGSFELIGSLDIRCANCHSELHAAQKQVYMGVGGRGLSDVPSRMFAAKVSCEGCHVEPAARSATPADELQARRRACVRCHSAGYDEMLDDWLRHTREAMQYVAPLEERARLMLERLRESHSEAGASVEFLRDALHNIDLVRRGRPAHNVEYAIRILGTSMDQISLAADELGEQLPAGPPPVLRRPDGYCSALCHDRLGTHRVEYFEEMRIDFDHEAHGHVACTQCHSALRHKERVISKQGCMLCHHSAEGQEEYGVGCEDCHGFESDLYYGRVRVSGVNVRPDSMSPDVSCTDCHRVQVEGENLRSILERCNECHGEPMDEDFLERQIQMRRRSDDLLVRIEQLRLQIEQLEREGMGDEQQRLTLAEITGDLDVVLRGRHLHNFEAAERILRKVELATQGLENQLR